MMKPLLFNNAAIPPAQAEKMGKDLVKLLVAKPASDSGRSLRRWKQKILTLIERGADLEQRDKNGNTPLGMALFHSYYREFSHLLIEAGADVNNPGIDNRPPLHLSICFAGDDRITLALIRAGADVNAHDPYHGRKPLHAAVFHGGLCIARTLLAGGADVNAENRDGQTPLIYAATANKKDVAEIFLNQENIDIDHRDNSDITAMMHAKARDHDEICALIQKAVSRLEERRIQGSYRCDSNLKPLPRIRLKPPH